jgi:primase-polymerase (primpol)-like protein
MATAKTYARCDAALFENIPAELKALPQWECWKLIEGKKVPINARDGKPYPKGIDSEDMATATFAEALSCFTKKPTLAGIGFRFKTTDPYSGFDLDDCRDPATGELQSWANDFVEQFGTYAEVSPSGTGVKLIGIFTLPKAIPKTNNVEGYSDGRYFALTGVPVNGQPRPIKATESQADSWYRQLTIKKRTPVGKGVRREDRARGSRHGANAHRRKAAARRTGGRSARRRTDQDLRGTLRRLRRGL